MALKFARALLGMPTCMHIKMLNYKSITNTMLKIVLFLTFNFALIAGQVASVKLLVLVSWPSDRDDAGWDAGSRLDLMTGGRVAVNEINNATDLLKDYHIELLVPECGHEACALRETSQGLVNFVQYSMYPPEQVLAVLGLYCSTSTKEISSFAGHESVQLIQLSAANSPIIDPGIHFDIHPHLWRFLASTSAYVEMMIELIKMFSWNDTTIVQTNNEAFAGISDVLMKEVHDKSQVKINVYHFFANRNLYNTLLDQLRDNGRRIIFLVATSIETASLLCRAAERGMLYPDYMWIVIDHLLSFLEDANQCDTSLLHLALNGSLLSHFSLEPQDKTVTLVNGDTYSTYESNYYKELDIVAEEYNQTLSGDHQYAGLLYDQVWGFALALNSSLPELSRRNLSVSDIGSLGYSEAKEILGKELSQLDFRGASGHIRFSNRSIVSTSIDMYQVINGKQASVGTCRVSYRKVAYCNVTLTEVPPSSEFNKVYLRFSQSLVIALMIITILMVFVITVVLVLFLYYRNRPEIKATSLKLSMLQFVACYILCIDLFNRTVVGINNHVAYCYVMPVYINATNIFLITLFLKLLRVYRIFHNRALKELNWKYSNGFLIFYSIVLSVIPNIFFVLWYWVDPVLQEDSQFITDGSMRYIEVAQHCSSAKNKFLNLIILVPYVYISFFTLGNVLLATWTANSYKNFKDTKKVNFVMAALFISSVVVAMLLTFIPTRTGIVYKHITSYIYSCIIILLCLSTLVPKLSFLKTFS